MEWTFRHFPLYRKGPDGSFCRIVIPWYIIQIEKGKKTVSISDKSLLICTNQIRLILFINNHSYIEIIYLFHERVKVLLFQAKSECFNDFETTQTGF